MTDVIMRAGIATERLQAPDSFFTRIPLVRGAIDKVRSARKRADERRQRQLYFLRMDHMVWAHERRLLWSHPQSENYVKLDFTRELPAVELERLNPLVLKYGKMTFGPNSVVLWTADSDLVDRRELALDICSVFKWGLVGCKPIELEVEPDSDPGSMQERGYRHPPSGWDASEEFDQLPD